MIKFEELDEDRLGGYYVRMLVNGKEGNIYLQNIDLLKNFVGLDTFDNTPVEKIEKGLQDLIDELSEYEDLTQDDLFEWGEPKTY